eukprot:scaffold2040_cov132-Skeletonema_menzelii.AAC.2
MKQARGLILHGTPLYVLCMNGALEEDEAVEILRLLIQRCPESLQCRTRGLLPIHAAIRYHSPKFCEVLVEACPDSIFIHHDDDEGEILPVLTDILIGSNNVDDSVALALLKMLLRNIQRRFVVLETVICSPLFILSPVLTPLEARDSAAYSFIPFLNLYSNVRARSQEMSHLSTLLAIVVLYPSSNASLKAALAHTAVKEEVEGASLVIRFILRLPHCRLSLRQLSKW